MRLGYSIRHTSHGIYSLLAATCMLPIAVSPAMAVDAPAERAAEKTTEKTIEAPNTSVEELVKLLRAQQEKITAQEAELQSQKEQMQLIASQVKALRQRTAEVPPQADGPAQAQSQPANADPKQVGVDRKPQPSESPPKVEAVAYDSGGGVLLAPGKAVFESGTEYTHSSALSVAVEGFTIVPALSIGSFEIADVDRDTAIVSVGGRLGIAKNLEIEARIPFVHREDSNISRPIGTGSTSNVLSIVDGTGLGDVEIGARYQIMKSDGEWPFLIGGLRFKSATGKGPFEVPINPATGLQTELPTGSGFYALQPSLTAIMPSDPVVLFSSIGYLYNMKRSFGGTIGEIDPGDSISSSFGMGFSVNERTSFSLGYSHDYVFETAQNGRDLANSTKLHVGALNTGFSYRVTDYMSFNTNISAGVTSDAPDMRFIFRVPISFDLY